jgi:hypothetical protein
VSRISGRTIAAQFFARYHAIGQNFNKMAINLDRRTIGIYSFCVFHMSLRSTFWTEIEFKSICIVENVPFQSLFFESQEMFNNILYKELIIQNNVHIENVNDVFFRKKFFKARKSCIM